MYYLSFANEHKFLGAAIVDAHDIAHAIQLTRELGINPGGSVLGLSIPSKFSVPEKYTNRLLTKRQVRALERETEAF